MSSTRSLAVDAAAVPAPIVAAIVAARRPWIISHRRPDPDTLGAGGALAVMLRSRGARPVHLCVDPVANGEDDPFLPGVQTTDDPATAPDLVVIVDCTADERTGGLLARHAERLAGVPVAVVDHHQSAIDEFGSEGTRWIDPSAAATCEMVVLIAVAMGIDLRVGHGRAAHLLAAGLVVDSGSLTHPEVSGRTFRAAGALREAGAPWPLLVHLAERARSPQRSRLQAHALSRVRLSAGGALAVLRLTARDFVRAGAVAADVEGIASAARDIDGVGMALLAVDEPDGRMRISIRARPGVSAIAVVAPFGGGGHPGAAGATIDPRALPRLVAAARRALR